MALLRAVRSSLLARSSTGIESVVCRQPCRNGSYTSGEEQAYRDIVMARSSPEMARAKPKITFKTQMVSWSQEVEVQKYKLTPEQEILHRFEVCGSMQGVRMHEKRMVRWSAMINGMMIDDAIAQCSGTYKRPGNALAQLLKRVQDAAPAKYAGEDKKNLYVHRCWASKGHCRPFIRYHGRGMFGRARIPFSNIFVELKVPIEPVLRWRFSKPHKIPEKDHPLLYVPYSPGGGLH